MTPGTLINVWIYGAKPEDFSVQASSDGELDLDCPRCGWSIRQEHAYADLGPLLKLAREHLHEVHSLQVIANGQPVPPDPVQAEQLFADTP